MRSARNRDEPAVGRRPRTTFGPAASGGCVPVAARTTTASRSAEASPRDDRGARATPSTAVSRDHSPVVARDNRPQPTRLAQPIDSQAQPLPGRPRKRGSTVGEIKTSPATRSGRRSANSITNWQPSEFATNAQRPRSSATMIPASTSAAAATSSTFSGRSLVHPRQVRGNQSHSTGELPGQRPEIGARYA